MTSCVAMFDSLQYQQISEKVESGFFEYFLRT